MSDAYDAIVIGLGAMGSATAYHLARRGARVLGLEQFSPGHTFGSLHGDSRIIRELYFENPLYVPLVQRAYELWARLEEDTGSVLLHRTGGLMIGPPASALVQGALRSGELHDLPHPVLAQPEIGARFPAFRLPPDFVGVWDERAGYLAPEACTAAHAALAVRSGAVLHYGEPMTKWQPDGDGVHVTTRTGEYRAARLALCVGAWTRAAAPELDLPLRIERQVLVWLDAPAPAARYDAPHFPIFICELEDGKQAYGFPRLERGVKTSVFHEGRLCDSPDLVERSVTPADVATLQAMLARVVPDLASATVRDAVTCLFTNTPDRHFLVDVHPQHPQVLLSSPCSGHGFKFASALGEIQADLLLDGHSRFDLRSFSRSRFSAA